jgi:uncharacterized protein (DUF4415 family)
MRRIYKNTANVDKKNSIEGVVETVSNKVKPIGKKQITLYIDEDVMEEFNEFGRMYGKGSKSRLVNNFLIEVFNIER